MPIRKIHFYFRSILYVIGVLPRLPVWLQRLLADEAVFFAGLLLLVSIGSFGLGRLADNPPAALSPTNQPTAVSLTQVKTEPVTATEVTTGQLVGSKNGTKYHALDCPGASQIKEENKRYFESVAAAQAAGYLPAKNCPKL